MFGLHGCLNFFGQGSRSYPFACYALCAFNLKQVCNIHNVALSLHMCQTVFMGLLTGRPRIKAALKFDLEENCTPKPNSLILLAFFRRVCWWRSKVKIQTGRRSNRRPKMAKRSRVTTQPILRHWCQASRTRGSGMVLNSTGRSRFSTAGWCMNWFQPIMNISNRSRDCAWRRGGTTLSQCSHVPFRRLFDRLPLRISTSHLHHRTQRKTIYQIRAYDFGVQFSFNEKRIIVITFTEWSRETVLNTYLEVNDFLRYSEFHGSGPVIETNHNFFRHKKKTETFFCVYKIKLMLQLCVTWSVQIPSPGLSQACQ